MPTTALPGDTVRMRITVSDVVGIQRVLTMLTGRRHALTRLAAEETDAGRWRLDLDVPGRAGDLELLTARLHRLPCVLGIDPGVR